jgi:hypothetical protein
MELESTMLSEKSHSKKDKYCMFSLMSRPKKENDMNIKCLGRETMGGGQKDSVMGAMVIEVLIFAF